MAKAYQCDACKKFVSQAYRRIGANVIVGESKMIKVFVESPIDLCKECFLQACEKLAKANPNDFQWKTEEEEDY